MGRVDGEGEGAGGTRTESPISPSNEVSTDNPWLHYYYYYHHRFCCCSVLALSPQSSITEQNSAEQHREQKHSIRNGDPNKNQTERINPDKLRLGILEGVASGQHQMRAIDFISPGTLEKGKS